MEYVRIKLKDVEGLMLKNFPFNGSIMLGRLTAKSLFLQRSEGKSYQPDKFRESNHVLKISLKLMSQ